MFSKQGFVTVCLVILTALLITGCFTTPTTVTGVTLDQTTMSLSAGEATGTLVATVAPATATNKSVTWSSSSEAVATVANGVVTPLTAGTTTITVTTVDGSFTATCVVTVAPVVVITTKAIPGVTAPVTGATPKTTITATTQYTGTVTWSPTATRFAAGTIYTATITLTAKTGYTLTGVAANFFTVAGATSDTNPANSGVVTAVFPVTATTITTKAIPGVTAPVTGATPVTTITATTQYTGTVTWSPTATTFAAGTIYTATITLTPKTGYTLTGVAANFFTVAGATSDTNPANSGVVTAVFPATAAPVIATSSTIANAASAPTITVTGTGFKASLAASDLTVTVGTTNLTLGTVTRVNATQITVAFTGTAAAGDVTIQAKTSAFDPVAGAVSNTLTVTVPAAAATVPSAITLAVGSANPVGGVTDVAIPAAGATDTTGAVTGWVSGTADMIKFTVTDAGSASSTITIGGDAYTSGANYTIPSTTSLTIIVTTTETGKTTGVRTFTVTVTRAAATVPSAITLAVGSANPVGGVTDVAIPAAGATDTTGAVTGWVSGTADMIKFTVTDAGSASSTITIGGDAYTSGANYTIPSTTSLTIIVTTVEAGTTTGVRTFTVTVTEA